MIDKMTGNMIFGEDLDSGELAAIERSCELTDDLVERIHILHPRGRGVNTHIVRNHRALLETTSKHSGEFSQLRNVQSVNAEDEHRSSHNKDGDYRRSPGGSQDHGKGRAAGTGYVEQNRHRPGGKP